VRTRSTLACLIFFCFLALVAASCANVEDLSPLSAGGSEPTFIDLGEVTVIAAARVEPGKALAVTVTAVNKSNGSLKPSDVELTFQGDAAWKDASLKLSAAALEGKTATFTGSLIAPEPGRYTLTWQAARAGRGVGPMVTAKVEVTCSDGVFCNGIERHVGGACVAGGKPCDDAEDCTADACDEATGTCSHTLGAGCAACVSDCVPDCAGKQCGSNGCGGSCGACGVNQGCASAVGSCKDASQFGTCNNPFSLLSPGEPLIGDHTLVGNSASALHQVVPTCNSLSTAVEVVYAFTATEKVGIDARSSGYDTVLHLRKADPVTPSAGCLNDKPEGTVKCSDDSSPPGDYGSRIATSLDPGTYYLIVDGFDSSQFGAFTLTARFTAKGCVPQCDGRYCGGDDGCGGNCGSCGTGFACAKRRCLPDPCVPDCKDKECGDDGCDGSCGACAQGELCIPKTSTCEAFQACDHDRPTCAPACGADAFCGTDCACHPVSDAMPDMVIDIPRLQKEILFETINVSADSCSIEEACVGGPGMRKLLRFSVEAVNQGQATLSVPPPDERPDLFQFSPCHGHYHFNGFANYALLDEGGKQVLTGHKQAYCMEDTRQVHQGPKIACEKQFDCSNQGIQAGWSDLYGNALDCQWLDVTDVPAGKYQIQVSLNPSRAFEELSFDNNVAVVPVTIP
jgi:hypothetical protein